MQPRARIVIVGDEILGGEVHDTNSPFLLRRLTELGFRVGGLRVVSDARPEIATAVREAAGDAAEVIVTGGIGPTHDDCTRPAVAEALDLPLVHHPEARARIERVFRGAATEADLTMADLPRGSEMIVAPGTPGFAFRVNQVTVYPGNPELLQPLFEVTAPRLEGRPGFRREVTTDLREGHLARPLEDLARKWPQVRWGSYPRFTGDGWKLRLVLRAGDEATLDRAEADLREALGRIRP